MAGLNGLTLGFRSDANVRVYKGTVMTKSVANVSSQTAIYASVPTAANQVPLGVSIDHFKEPNFFIPQPTGTAGSGTNFPENITGTTPQTYNLMGREIPLQVNGLARCIAGVTNIPQGAILIIADVYGRVKPLAGLASGTYFYAIGYAQFGTQNLDDIIQVTLDFFTGTA
jgi:hypothetical protein